MHYLPHKLHASRGLALICCANTLSFAFANLLSIPVALTPLLYLICLAPGLALLRPLTIASNSNRPSVALWVLAVSFIAAMVLPRLVYPLEWWQPLTTDAMFDDYARLAELIAMTLSENYPLQHPASESLLLSFYYAAFYPMAVMKLLIPLLTLKDTLFLGCGLYAILLGLSLLEISLRLGRTQSAAVVLLFLCTWFGGLDWLTGPLLPLYSHSEWWAQQLFDRPSQISALPTTANWAIHHFLGFYLPVLAWIFWRYSRGHFHWQKPILVPLLLVAGLYHSPFGFLPVAVLGLPWLLPLLRRYLPRWSNALLLLILLAPLSVFLGRLPGNTLQLRLPLLLEQSPDLAGYSWSAASYLLALPLIDLAALPLLLVLLWPRFSGLEKYLALASLLFFLSTLVLFMPLFNNYSMRGMLLPSFICFTLIARHWHGLEQSGGKVLINLTVVLLVLAGVGGAREFLSSARYALWANSHTRQSILDESAHPTWYGEYKLLARDASIRVLPAVSDDYRQRRPYLAEKRLPDTPAAKLTLMEREIARLPQE